MQGGQKKQNISYFKKKKYWNNEYCGYEIKQKDCTEG